MILKITGLQAKGRPRFSSRGRMVRAYTPASTAEYENRIKAAYAAQGGGEKWMNGEALALTVTAYRHIPSGKAKKWRFDAANDKIRPTTRPDIDNYLKIAMDGLNGIAYADDKQIVYAVCEKRYTDGEEYMLIEVREWLNETYIPKSLNKK